MAQGNESLCLLVFHCFGILCVVYSCVGLYNLTTEFIKLTPEEQSICKPYAVWKTMFLFHINLFFVGLSFAVGTCDTFLNEDDMEILDANSEPEREYTTRIVETSLSVLKTHCAVFCGPFILVECILCMVYYTSITQGC